MSIRMILVRADMWDSSSGERHPECGNWHLVGWRALCKNTRMRALIQEHSYSISRLLPNVTPSYYDVSVFAMHLSTKEPMFHGLEHLSHCTKQVFSPFKLQVRYMSHVTCHTNKTLIHACIIFQMNTSIYPMSSYCSYCIVRQYGVKKELRKPQLSLLLSPDCTMKRNAWDYFSQICMLQSV